MKWNKKEREFTVQKNLSKRLKKIAECVPEGVKLADIGSDHAYLPIFLCQKGRIHQAIASEVSQGPFEHMCSEVEKAGLSESIDCRLGDGLVTLRLEDQVEAVTIAGMGGELIAKILHEAYCTQRLQNRPCLILQPNIDEILVRKWLIGHGYRITDEKILEDAGKMYEIIVALPTDTPQELTDVQLLMGIYTKKDDPEVFNSKWQRKQANLKGIIEQMEHSDQQELRETFKKKFSLIQQELEEDADEKE